MYNYSPNDHTHFRCHLYICIFPVSGKEPAFDIIYLRILYGKVSIQHSIQINFKQSCKKLRVPNPPVMQGYILRKTFGHNAQVMSKADQGDDRLYTFPKV